MKYILPIVLMGAAVYPSLGLPWYAAAISFVAGAFFGVLAYGVPDVPFAVSYTENYFGDDCCGE